MIIMFVRELYEENIRFKTIFFLLKKWTSSLIWAVLVVTLSTSFVMGVNIGGPNVYNSVSFNVS